MINSPPDVGIIMDIRSDTPLLGRSCAVYIRLMRMQACDFSPFTVSAE